jgi:hypothetical protein
MAKDEARTTNRKQMSVTEALAINYKDSRVLCEICTVDFCMWRYFRNNDVTRRKSAKPQFFPVLNVSFEALFQRAQLTIVRTTSVLGHATKPSWDDALPCRPTSSESLMDPGSPAPNLRHHLNRHKDVRHTTIFHKHCRHLQHVQVSAYGP